MNPSIRAIRTGFTNCFLLRGRQSLLIDTGASAKTRALLGGLRAIVEDPRHISLILATHGHWDHIGAVPEVRGATGAGLAMHRADAEWVCTGIPAPLVHREFWGRLLLRMMGPIFKLMQGKSRLEADLVFGDEGIDLGERGIPARVVPSPGHTPGSVSVLLETGEAIVGDLAMSGPPLVFKPSLAPIASDPEQLKNSWRLLVDLGARIIYPAHGKPFPVDALKI